jgi:para-aminobenzoate synthetase / 4-amino-4-deoxychorismate lyase
MHILETILYHNQQFYLLHYHFQRLWHSMCYFKYMPATQAENTKHQNYYACFYAYFNTYLKNIYKDLCLKQEHVYTQCIRIMVDEQGHITHTIQKLLDMPIYIKSHYVQLVFAAQPIDTYTQKQAEIALWTHKTTQRKHYEYFYNNTQYKNTPYTDVILYNKQGFITECTKANIAYLATNGIWYTPTLNHGAALAGTMRQNLLYQKQIQCKEILINELTQAKNIIWFNALRGVMPAQIIL